MKNYTKVLVKKYLVEIYKFFECPKELSYVSTRLEMIISGDFSVLLDLKTHCDYIDIKIFDSLMKSIEVDTDRISEHIKGSLALPIDANKIDQINKLISYNKLKVVGFEYDKKKELIFNHNRCIKYLIETMKFAKQYDDILVFNHIEGVYELADDLLLGRIIKYILNDANPDSWELKFERNVIEGLKREVFNEIDNSFDENLIAVNNGVLKLDTLELLPHDPRYMFTNKLPIDYNANAEAPIFINAIKEITQNNLSLEKVLQEVMGNVLTRSTKAGKAIFFYGVGSNGKSFCADIMGEILGYANVSNIPLSNFQKNFGLEGILGKKLNICNENDINGYISSEEVKSLATGDRINIRRKHTSDANYKPDVKLIFCMNTLPNTKDNTHGFYRKIMIIPFNRIFKKDEVDKDLKSKVVNELSGVLNWCLIGLKRLVDNKYEFTKSEVVEDIMKKYKFEQNAVEEFFEEMMVEVEEECITKRDVFENFLSWSEDKGVNTKKFSTAESFWKALNIVVAIHETELQFKMNNGERYLKNFKLKDNIIRGTKSNFIFKSN